MHTPKSQANNKTPGECAVCGPEDHEGQLAAYSRDTSLTPLTQTRGTQSVDTRKWIRPPIGPRHPHGAVSVKPHPGPGGPRLALDQRLFPAPFLPAVPSRWTRRRKDFQH
ncbi:hypothetical protein CSOJ01_00464 [Colletotrichum sojae]|uniref:Uncharacterized protein n=1 Tax=Colletotrichum sojae TaxID=2175907 RepID=A0A8H6N5L1_9PEZI|nr:hypothetical protein CSOJ01_00464 [Colletotrichum sojae]